MDDYFILEYVVSYIELSLITMFYPGTSEKALRLSAYVLSLVPGL